ncbi:carbohydrate kinase [Devosia sp. XJ19-1]|uniref:Carbohydrate kinase n=1 Tax=Devosia ureilytica TaxID=2952754 RepID=A0A9Q4FQP6_9HYPH|nr:FGGY-family carbohydrate kinase [Devosia ureilytica]MCP8883201.1 carbohydrate kinase [Devosia ureilytica]MCP8886431.1 carbohydrate kinase [Devosia ureilytica]
MADYLLGLDAGNTVIKAALFDAADGRELAVVAQDGHASLPAPGHVERDLGELWANAITVISACITKAGIDPINIRAIGCAGHGNGLYALDRAGQPLIGIQSLDTRAVDLVGEWEAEKLGARTYPICRQGPWSAQTPTLLAWVKRHRPDLYGQIGTVLLCKDFVVGQLTGARVSETTDMSGCGLISVPGRAYDAGLLEHYGLMDARPMLPDLLESADIAGHITPNVAAATGLKAGTPVIAGLFDVVASALGSGVSETGQASIIAGSWGINQVVLDQPIDQPPVFMQSSFDRTRWLAIESSATSAANLEWLVHQFMADVPGDRFGLASELVSTVQASDDTPIYHPFLYGAQQNGRARAGFYGIGGWHGRAHMLRALFEGVVFEHARHIDVLRRAGAQISSATLSGGGSRSSIWPQIFADVLDVPVTVARSRETGALGAAIAAGAGVGLFADYAAGTKAMTAPARHYDPQSHNAPHYAARRQIYTELAQAMTPLWAKMGHS